MTTSFIDLFKKYCTVLIVLTLVNVAINTATPYLFGSFLGQIVYPPVGEEPESLGISILRFVYEYSFTIVNFIINLVALFVVRSDFQRLGFRSPLILLVVFFTREIGIGIFLLYVFYQTLSKDQLSVKEE